MVAEDGQMTARIRILVILCHPNYLIYHYYYYLQRIQRTIEGKER